MTPLSTSNPTPVLPAPGSSHVENPPKPQAWLFTPQAVLFCLKCPSLNHFNLSSGMQLLVGDILGLQHLKKKSHSLQRTALGLSQQAVAPQCLDHDGHTVNSSESTHRKHVFPQQRERLTPRRRAPFSKQSENSSSPLAKVRRGPSQRHRCVALE